MTEPTQKPNYNEPSTESELSTATHNPEWVEQVSGKFKDFQSSDHGRQLSALFQGEVHNLYGLIAAAALVVCLFLPALSLPLNMGSMSLITGFWGKLILLALIAAGIGFYGGATQRYTQIAVMVALAILSIQLIRILHSLSQISSLTRGIGGESLFGSVSIISVGFYLSLLAGASLAYITFKMPYRENPDAI